MYLHHDTDYPLIDSYDKSQQMETGFISDTKFCVSYPIDVSAAHSTPHIQPAPTAAPFRTTHSRGVGRG